MSISSILKSIFGSLVRNWMAALLVVLFSHHWITSDQENQVTVWFAGYSNVLIDTLLAALIPAAIGIYLKLRDKFKQEVARLLPADTPMAAVRAVVRNSTFRQIVTVTPSPYVIRHTVN